MINACREGFTRPDQFDAAYIYYNQKELSDRGTTGKGNLKNILEKKCRGFIYGRRVSLFDVIIDAANGRRIVAVSGHILCSSRGNDKFMTLRFDAVSNFPTIIVDVARYDFQNGQEINIQMDATELFVTRLAWPYRQPLQTFHDCFQNLFHEASMCPIRRRAPNRGNIKEIPVSLI